jgi:hypothetical protein
MTGVGPKAEWLLSALLERKQTSTLSVQLASLIAGGSSFIPTSPAVAARSNLAGLAWQRMAGAGRP